MTDTSWQSRFLWWSSNQTVLILSHHHFGWGHVRHQTDSVAPWKSKEGVQHSAFNFELWYTVAVNKINSITTFVGAEKSQIFLGPRIQ